MANDDLLLNRQGCWLTKLIRFDKVWCMWPVRLSSTKAQLYCRYLITAQLQNSMNISHATGPTRNPASDAFDCLQSQRLRISYKNHEGSPATRDEANHWLLRLLWQWQLSNMINARPINLPADIRMQSLKSECLCSTSMENRNTHGICAHTWWYWYSFCRNIAAAESSPVLLWDSAVIKRIGLRNKQEENSSTTWCVWRLQLNQWAQFTPRSGLFTKMSWQPSLLTWSHHCHAMFPWDSLMFPGWSCRQVWKTEPNPKSIQSIEIVLIPWRYMVGWLNQPQSVWRQCLIETSWIFWHWSQVDKCCQAALPGSTVFQNCYFQATIYFSRKPWANRDFAFLWTPPRQACEKWIVRLRRQLKACHDQCSKLQRVQWNTLWTSGQLVTWWAKHKVYDGSMA